MSKPNAADRLTQWILARAESEPLSSRIVVLRDTAATVAGPKVAPSLVKLAEDLESIEQRCRQLRLDLGDSTTN